MNVKNAEKYLREEKKQIISAIVIGKIYKSLRKLIYNYLYRVYQHDLLLEENQHQFCSIDESQFSHSKKGDTILFGFWES